jgi:hypothetical protein
VKLEMLILGTMTMGHWRRVKALSDVLIESAVFLLALTMEALTMPRISKMRI